MEKKLVKKEVYFAAANGYSGFRSYFDEVFRPTDYDAIYVIKGGPGTGKSSFMRRISAELSGEADGVEEILCSSDPGSLDGVIIRLGDKSVALLDGTAPHECDADIPGAIGCIINLGASWDARWLRSKRDKIISLSEQKKKAYGAAYHYLRICGISATAINGEKKLFLDNNIIISQIKHTAELIDGAESGKQRTRLISAFGKSGYITIPTLGELCSKQYTAIGNPYVVSAYLSRLIEYLCNESVAHTVFPSPLDKDEIEGVFIPSIGISISKFEGGEHIDLTSAFDKSRAEQASCLKVSEEIYERAYAEAERWFYIASDFHSRLEEIYGEAMNFDMVDLIYDEVSRDIRSILF